MFYFIVGNGEPENAISGTRITNYNHGHCSRTAQTENPTWWLIDLGQEVTVTSVVITSRNQGGKIVNILKQRSQYLATVASIYSIICHFSSRVNKECRLDTYH